MTVNTIKFSQFAAATLSQSNNMNVGVGGGVNYKTPIVSSWTTSGRPTPYAGLLGYNTDLSQYEFWDGTAWLTLAAGGIVVTNWKTITAASIQVNGGDGIIANRSATPVQIELPASFNIGDEIGVMGLGAGGWTIVANTGQTIKFGSVTTSSAGSISSDIQYANLFIRGLVANTTWTVVLINSNPTYL